MANRLLSNRASDRISSMTEMLRAGFAQAGSCAYHAARPLVFRQSAQQAHDSILHLLGWIEARPAALALVRLTRSLSFTSHKVHTGGVTLPYPLILAAGLVKGVGFVDEAEALAAVARDQNIIPGWQAMPALVGPVEFGSYTRWPRMGNPGVVMWRDPVTYSTQNRVGLKNPGAKAAAAFLARHKHALPPVFGINVAVSPGVTEPDRQRDEVRAAVRAFVDAGVCPSWFTLNLSCPNTEDDPGSHQTEDESRSLCQAVIEILRSAPVPAGKILPLWVKIGPEVGEEQITVLMRVFHETGVQAVIATNTLSRPAPDQSGLPAGVGGGKLHRQAVRVAAMLAREKQRHNYAVDVIGCGGVLDPASYHRFARHGITTVQYWTGLIYHGPLAAARILAEIQATL
jgi:dihydroorotate dehydrogenase